MAAPAGISEDPVALRSPGMCRFFGRVMERQMRAGFRAVRVLRPGLPDLPPGAPVVIYANHPSWWDPAFFMVLHARLLAAREGYGPIDAAMLERYRFMRRIGLFGIEPGTRAGAARFLEVGAHVLSGPSRMIWMTAQGRFADPRERPVTIRPGLAHLLERVPDVVAVPLAVEYPFWTEKRPEALAAFGPPAPNPQATGRAARLRERQAALEDGLTRALDRLADAARARDAGAFDRVLGGRRGVGGVYGLWSRLRARAAGRRYDPDHMADTAR